jgi:hypothetical protein
MAARRKAAAQAPAEDWTRREPEADEHTGQDDHHEAEDEAREGDDQDEAEDQDQGENVLEAGEAEDEDAEADFAALSTVDHDADQGQGPAADFAAAMRRDSGASSGDGIALGDASETDRVRLGIDPVDPETHVRQARDRTGLQNGQTDHEAANGLDAISGTANPGVTETVRHSAPGKLGASDMSGRAPLPDPFANLDTQARGVMEKLSKASQDAHQRGRANGHGWLDLRQLGVSKAVMDALEKAGAVDRSHRPGGEFSPETGTVYRIKGHDKAA